MVTVSIHQPNFMPWLKLLAKVLESDVHIAYDSVQFTRQEFHARQRFRTRAGNPEWLTVPVLSTGTRQILHTVRVAPDTGWREAHLHFLETHYSQAPCFGEVFPLIRAVYERRHPLLADHNLDLLEQFCRYLGSGVRIIRATSLEHTGTREERLLDLVRNAGGDAHLTSTTDTHFIDWAGFEDAGIPVRLQVFEHPVYSQGAGSFTLNLAAADLLFHAGTAARDILASSSRSEPRRSAQPAH